MCEDKQWSALHAACAGGHSDIVALLLKIGANVTQSTKEHEMTPLYIGKSTSSLLIKALFNTSNDWLI